MDNLILKILMQFEIISELEANEALNHYQNEQGMLIAYLIDELNINDSALANYFGQFFNLDFFNLNENKLTVLDHLSIDQLKPQNILLLSDGDETYLAISDPNDLHLTDRLSFQYNIRTNPVFIPYYQLLQHTDSLLCNALFSSITEKNMPELSQQIINHALHSNASDIHFEPQKNALLVRCRRDGLLEKTLLISPDFSNNIISQLKLMAGLDIAEKRKPQDGRFTFKSHCGLKRDCRLNACPTLFGEKVVIRLLRAEKNKLSFTQLGFDEQQKKIIYRAINKPQGLILVTGPTGSGKTMTLYTMLQALNSNEKNISTIEDPIEIQLNGINQVNINPKIQFDFPDALRAFLRQDPDIIMIGEIRDKTTADLAIRAAHTGHLVLSTLHTNSAAETITRLINMGIKPFNLASTLSLIIAQRLIRLINHKKQDEYQGRTGIYEIVEINDEIKSLIVADNPAVKMSDYMKKNHIKKLKELALEKFKLELTTLQEANRVIA